MSGDIHLQTSVREIDASVAMSGSERQSKRQRISQACDYCRKRKSKCDGAQPVCSVCRLFNKPCEYGNAKKRGLQSGYVRGLETLLGLALQHIPTSEVRIRTLLREKYSTASFNDGELVDPCTDVWRSSDLAKDLDVLLVTGGDEMDRLPSLEAVDETTPVQHVERPESSGLIREIPRQDEVRPLPMLPQNTSELVDFYFQTTHCWFPIVERCDILRVMYDGDQEDYTQARSESRLVCLWSIVSYTSCMVSPEMRAAMSPTPEQMYSRVWSCLMADGQTFVLDHVQALLILILHEIGKGNLRSAWILTAQANRMQMDIGARGTERPKRYQHIVHGCRYLDAVLSAILGQPALATRDNYDSCPSLDTSGLEEWESWSGPETGHKLNRRPLRALSTFNMLGQLAQRLHGILERPVGHDMEEDIRYLQTWHSTLPKSYRLNDEPASPPLLVLHLTWELTLLTAFTKMSEVDRKWTRLIQDSVKSTTKLIDQYIELTSVPGSSPLLVAFASRVERCLELFRMGKGPMSLSTTQKLLKDHYNTHQEMPNPDCQFLNTSNENAESFAHPGFTPGIFGEKQREAPFSAFPDQSLEENGYDDLFDEVLSFVPPRTCVLSLLLVLHLQLTFQIQRGIHYICAKSRIYK